MILAKSLRYESVIRRVMDGRIKNPIQSKHPTLFVQLVFCAASLWDLDYCLNYFGLLGPYLYVVPWIHSSLVKFAPESGFHKSSSRLFKNSTSLSCNE